MAAAREVFEDLGYNAARISDIARRAQMSYGSFYHYFDSKEAVLREVLTVVAGEMFLTSQAPRDAADDPVARIEAANRRYLAALGRNAGLMAVIEEMAFRDPAMRELKLSIREPYLRRNEAGIRRLQERGLADADLDPRMAAVALGGMVEHLSHLLYIHRVDLDEELAVKTLTQVWARGIGVERLGGDSDPAGA
ncbi:TetR/AcrR family transcriptional regulator [Mycolicibacterium thermoresistibile]